MEKFLIYISAFILTGCGVEVFRRWSLRRRLLDVPNPRSSHTAPTPRGGGIVMVLVCLFFFPLYIWLSGGVLAPGYMFGAFVIALVSWLDDLFSVSFVWRFAVHSIAALAVVLDAGFAFEIYIPFLDTVRVGNAGAIIVFCWIVWLTNAFNFMDGIDGIAGLQTVIAGIGWFFVGNLLGYSQIGFYGGLLAAAGLGFLIHNWPPAKIFMGDVGSAFLGFTFAALPFLPQPGGVQNRGLLFFSGVLLVWLFVFDTVLTMLGRLLRGEKIWEAHRKHLYQKMVIHGYTHRQVTIIYGIISIIIGGLICFWLWKFEKMSGIIIILAVGFVSGLLLYREKKIRVSKKTVDVNVSK